MKHPIDKRSDVIDERNLSPLLQILTFIVNKMELTDG